MIVGFRLIVCCIPLDDLLLTKVLQPLADHTLLVQDILIVIIRKRRIEFAFRTTEKMDAHKQKYAELRRQFREEAQADLGAAEAEQSEEDAE